LARAAIGIVWISIPAQDQANRFKAVANLGTLGTVFCACHRLPETTTFRLYIRMVPTAPNAATSPRGGPTLQLTTEFRA